MLCLPQQIIIMIMIIMILWISCRECRVRGKRLRWWDLPDTSVRRSSGNLFVGAILPPPSCVRDRMRMPACSRVRATASTATASTATSTTRNRTTTFLRRRTPTAAAESQQTGRKRNENPRSRSGASTSRTARRACAACASRARRAKKDRHHHHHCRHCHHRRRCCSSPDRSMWSCVAWPPGTGLPGKPLRSITRPVSTLPRPPERPGPGASFC
mmetsp:Transcript_30110/g.70998  ORF Transcript_30110/g.70998 Transcript_30110/m.70998 type:complete len:214 (-) Transcript_30110:154-795(-)